MNTENDINTDLPFHHNSCECEDCLEHETICDCFGCYEAAEQSFLELQEALATAN